MKFLELMKTKKAYFTVLILSSLYLFAYMMYGLIYKQFWYDEVAILGFMRTGVSFGEMVNYYLNIEASNLPLYQIIMYVIYNIFPPEKVFLLMPSVILTIVAVILIVNLADRLYGRTASYVVIMMAIFSTTVINRIGLLLRAYALMFFGTALCLYLLFKIKDDYNVKNIIKLTVALIVLVYSHYFGTLMFGVLFVLVFLYSVIGRKGFKRIIPFIISGCLYAPWFLMAMKTRVTDVDSFWIDAPGIKKVAGTIGYLLGGNVIACGIYAISFVVMAVLVIKRKQLFSIKSAIVFIPVLVIGIIFVYSNIGGSLYEDRYFIILLPEMLLTIGAFCQEMWNYFMTKKRGAIVIVLGFLVLIATDITSFVRCYGDTTAVYIRYSGAADYIKNNCNISDSDVLIITRDYCKIDEIVARGWYDYYLYRRGYQAKNIEHYSNGYTIQTEIIDSYGDAINTVYVFAPEELTGYEGDNFEMTFSDNLFRLTEFKRKKGVDNSED